MKIHQDALILIKNTLSEISQYRQSRTILLYGGRGVGKTHFLGRLKETLNDKAFFAYIEVVTPLIRSNLPGRVALRTATEADSKIILGETDAAYLLGKGDLLYQSGANLLRLQSLLAMDVKLPNYS